MRKLLFLLAAVSLISISCHRDDSSVPVQKTMFTLSFGAMEDELGGDAYISMSDGFFFISDTEQKKIMKFNSYGDLLALHYNDNEGVSPVLLMKNEKTMSPGTGAAEFPFISPSHIIADMNQNIFVADKTPDYLHKMSDRYTTSLIHAVHCFGADGSYKGRLGTEGPGSSPFPLITKLETNLNGHLIVHTLVPEARVIYWFDEKLEPLYTLEFTADEFMAEENGMQLIASPDSASVSKKGYFIYFNVNFYNRENSLSYGGDNDVDFCKSSVYTYDVSKREFTGCTDIPVTYMLSEKTRKSISVERLETVYQLLGTHDSDILFFISPVSDKRYNLLTIKADGSIIANTHIEWEKDCEYFSELTVNSDGIISTLLRDGDKVHAVWWRSDRLLPDFRKSLPSPF